MSEEDDELKTQRNEALQEKADYESLTANPGWRRLVAWMQAQERTRIDHLILQPCTGVKSQLEMEFSKGEVAMMRLLQQIVAVGLETATAVVRSLDEYDSNRTAESDADDSDS